MTRSILPARFDYFNTAIFQNFIEDFNSFAFTELDYCFDWRADIIAFQGP